MGRKCAALGCNKEVDGQVYCRECLNGLWSNSGGASDPRSITMVGGRDGSSNNERMMKEAAIKLGVYIMDVVEMRSAQASDPSRAPLYGGEEYLRGKVDAYRSVIHMLEVSFGLSGQDIQSEYVRCKNKDEKLEDSNDA